MAILLAALSIGTKINFRVVQVNIKLVHPVLTQGLSCELLFGVLEK